MQIVESNSLLASKVFSSAYLNDNEFNKTFNSAGGLHGPDADSFFNYLTSSFQGQGYSTYCLYEGSIPVAAINFGMLRAVKKPNILSLARPRRYIEGLKLRHTLDSNFLNAFSKYSQLVSDQSLSENYLSISQLGVLQEHRRKGYASKLVNFAFEEAQQIQACKGLQVATYSAINTKIYKSLGFLDREFASENGINCWILTKEK